MTGLAKLRSQDFISGPTKKRLSLLHNLPVSKMCRSSKCAFSKLLPPKTTTLLPRAVHVWNERGSGCRPEVGFEIHSIVSKS